jgi:2-O-(6-phospho-alpha-D-mannosyl)-D-glycerate hydrolase
LSALFLPADRYPRALLDVGWRQLVLNSAHDSSCACSHDEVVDAVIVRYQEARQVGDALVADALHHLATTIDAAPGSTVVVNPTQAARGGLVHGFVPGEGPLHFVADDGSRCAAQVLRQVGGEGFATVVTGQKVRWVLELMRGPEFAGTRIARIDREHAENGEWEFTFHAARPGVAPLDLEETRDELLALGEAGATVRFRVVLAPAREFVFAPDTLSGFGWRTYAAADGDGPLTGLEAGVGRLANEHLEVVVDPADGTLTLRSADGVEVSGADRLVDGGDGGDTYSFSPPAVDRTVDAPRSVRITTLEHGPVRARLLVERVYDLPTHGIGDVRSLSSRSDDTVEVEVRTVVELRAGERFVRVRTEIDNRVRDHRLRVHFPLPAPVTGSDAECAFAVVHRGLDAEGGPHEVGLPTFVSRRFVDCSDGEQGLAVLHDGLLEYEVVEGGRELALTLLRAIGFLSRTEPSLRPNPAGPPDPLEGPQLQRRLALSYALLPHRGDWRAASLHDAADEFLVPLERVRGGGVAGANRAPSGVALHVDGAQVSAVQRDGDAVVVRVFNASPEAASATIDLHGQPARGWLVDLIGRPLGQLDGSFPLRPWEIVTVRIGDDSGDQSAGA